MPRISGAISPLPISVRSPAEFCRHIFICSVHFPGLAIGLSRHIGQRIKAILRLERDFITRLVLGTRALLMKSAGRVEIAVRRSVEFRRVALQWVSAELFDINSHGRSQPLRP